MLAIVLAGCGGVRTAPGVAGPPPAFVEGWVVERPALDALFPEGALVSATEHWEWASDRWRHCYAAEAEAREGERGRFAREAGRLGYRLAETPLGGFPTFVADGVSAVQMLPPEDDAFARGVESMMEELGESIERTVTVRVCVDHPAGEGAERSAAFLDALDSLAPARAALASHAGPLRQVRRTVTADGVSASVVYAFEGDPDPLDDALAARGFAGAPPTWTRGPLTIQLAAGELTATQLGDGSEARNFPGRSE